MYPTLPEISTDQIQKPIQLGSDLEETFANIKAAEQRLAERRKREADAIESLGRSSNEAYAFHQDLGVRLDAIEAHVHNITVATVEDAARAFLYWTNADPNAFGVAISKVSKELR